VRDGKKKTDCEGGVRDGNNEILLLWGFRFGWVNAGNMEIGEGWEGGNVL
jgi:hypothetical protein